MDTAERHVAFCPHCGNTAPQRVALRHTFYPPFYDSDGTPDQDTGMACEAIVCICDTCNDVLLYSGISQSEFDVWPKLSYPTNPDLHESVPDPIRCDYREACRIKNQAPNAFAVMIRRALERICDDKKIISGSLAKRIKVLVEQGHLPPVLAEVTEILRLLGNTGAHAGSVSVTVPQTWMIDDFFRVIAEYVYVAPSKLADFRKRLIGQGSADASEEDADRRSAAF